MLSCSVNFENINPQDKLASEFQFMSKRGYLILYKSKPSKAKVRTMGPRIAIFLSISTDIVTYSGLKSRSDLLKMACAVQMLPWL